MFSHISVLCIVFVLIYYNVKKIMLPLILIVHIAACRPVYRCLSHGKCLYQVIMTLHFLNYVVRDVESTRKSTITLQSLD